MVVFLWLTGQSGNAKEAAMHQETIRFSTQDGIARLTLHRPERLNALTAQLHERSPPRCRAALKSETKSTRSASGSANSTSATRPERPVHCHPG